MVVDLFGAFAARALRSSPRCDRSASHLFPYAPLWSSRAFVGLCSGYCSCRNTKLVNCLTASSDLGAWKTPLDRKVGIKFLRPESVADEQAKKRLIREARAAAKLDRPTSARFICPGFRLSSARSSRCLIPLAKNESRGPFRSHSHAGLRSDCRSAACNKYRVSHPVLERASSEPRTGA